MPCQLEEMTTTWCQNFISPNLTLPSLQYIDEEENYIKKVQNDAILELASLKWQRRIAILPGKTLNYDPSVPKEDELPARSAKMIIFLGYIYKTILNYGGTSAMTKNHVCTNPERSEGLGNLSEPHLTTRLQPWWGLAKPVPVWNAWKRQFDGPDRQKTITYDRLWQTGVGNWGHSNSQTKEGLLTLR